MKECKDCGEKNISDGSKFCPWCEKYNLVNQQIEKSKGHIIFRDGYEYILDDSEIFRAYNYLPIDVNGYRQGLRFVCPDNDDNRSYFIFGIMQGEFLE